MSSKQVFPKKLSLNGVNFTLRLLEPSDRNAILTMAQHLPEADLAFMRRDITNPDAVDDWVRDVQNKRAFTLLVEDSGQIIGYGTLYLNHFFWNRHVAEVRILVSSAYRNRGVGKRLVRELMAQAKEHRLEKVIVYMAVDDKSARRMVEDVGFRPEAVLADWIKMRDERTKDLLIMAASLDEMQS